MAFLIKLRDINFNRYNEYLESIKKQLVVKEVKKYEYWDDPPYRTVKNMENKQLLDEKLFWEEIYRYKDIE